MSRVCIRRKFPSGRAMLSAVTFLTLAALSFTRRIPPQTVFHGTRRVPEVGIHLPWIFFCCRVWQASQAEFEIPSGKILRGWEPA
jgi:hypothetical protein